MADAKRIVEVRLMLIAHVDVAHPVFAEALAALPQPSTVPHAISSEVISNLESVPYVESIIVCAL